MTTQRTAPRHPAPTAARLAQARTDAASQVFAGILLCVAVLTGGAFAGHAWLVDTCPTTPDLAPVCTAVLG